MSNSEDIPADKLLVQIATYNTNLQGNAGVPQDLVDWLAPTLTVSSFLSRGRQAPDIVAVGFQELLPLHFGLAGLSSQVIQTRDDLIRSQIEHHAPNKDRYTLIARIVNVGIALLVYARDEALGGRVRDVRTQWTGCGPGWMGNKGAVGVRFRVDGSQGDEGEVFTFVNAHLTAHAGKIKHRIADYHHIVSTLLFPPNHLSSSSSTHTSIYDTSHLFFLGDLNFRLSLPSDPLPTFNQPYSNTGSGAGAVNLTALIESLNEEKERERLKEHDELFKELQSSDAFMGLKEGEFWKFKCTYKYKLGEVDRYDSKRLPAWTDRVLYASYLDPRDTPDKSSIQNVLYTSIPSYTTSDHKPVVSLLLVPTSILSPLSNLASPRRRTLYLPVQPPCPLPYASLKRYTGRLLDRLVGFTWTFFWLIGLGNAAGGVFNFLLGVLAMRWMNASSAGAGTGEREGLRAGEV